MNNTASHCGGQASDDAAAVIDLLKARFRLKSDTDLALKLLVSRSTVANWRNRNSVPDRYRRIAQGKDDFNAFAHTDLSEVERAGLRLALLRLVKDFGEMATSYEHFLAVSGTAARSLQGYLGQATCDVLNEMEANGTDDAVSAMAIFALKEFSKGE